MIHLKGCDFRQRSDSTDQHLRELRVKRDRVAADVEIICAQMQTDFLHSDIGTMHSNYIRTMLKCYQTPLRISLLNCQYKAVSAVIDWMYTSEMEVTVEECGEHLKVVSSLGVDKLQQILENTLKLLASQADCAICCINTATDPQCSVSFTAQKTICEKFVATMHTLPDNDIQKVTLNAVIALVASPHIKLKEKIGTVNFALQWLKNPAHSQFLDVVLGSLYIEELKSSELMALIDHLRQLYRELPRSLLASICIYICNKRIVVCDDSRKYKKNNSVVVSKLSAGVSEAELEYKSAEIEKMIGTKVNTSYVAGINSFPDFEELIKNYQLISSSSQEFTDACVFTFKDFSGQIANFSGKHRISQEQKFFQYSNDIEASLDTPRLAAAGNLNEENYKAAGCHSLGLPNPGNISYQFPTGNSESVNTADASAGERTVGRNAFSSDSLAEIREIRDLFSHKSVKRPHRTTSACVSETVARINQLPQLLPNYTGAFEYQKTSGKTDRNLSSPSTETINRNLHGVESVTDIANIPKQFYGKKYFTPNRDYYRGGSRAVYNLTEQIRQMKNKLYGFDITRNMRNYWHEQEVSQESDLQTVNRYAFGEQSLADIRDIKSQFSISDDGLLTSEQCVESTGTSARGTTATQPYSRYTTSEVQDINAYPEFVREDQVIGKKAFTREEYEELRGIPSITDKEPRKLPIINRYELPDDEQSDIKNLPDIVDSQYALGRGTRSEEEIREINALPDMLANSTLHSYSSASDPKPSAARSTPTSGVRSSGLLSAYVAPDMRSRHFDSPVLSEYVARRP